jgi:ubiquitin C-terminal hydrolase
MLVNKKTQANPVICGGKASKETKLSCNFLSLFVSTSVLMVLQPSWSTQKDGYLLPGFDNSDSTVTGARKSVACDEPDVGIRTGKENHGKKRKKKRDEGNILDRTLPGFDRLCNTRHKLETVLEPVDESSGGGVGSDYGEGTKLTDPELMLPDCSGSSAYLASELTSKNRVLESTTTAPGDTVDIEPEVDTVVDYVREENRSQLLLGPRRKKKKKLCSVDGQNLQPVAGYTVSRAKRTNLVAPFGGGRVSGGMDSEVEVGRETRPDLPAFLGQKYCNPDQSTGDDRGNYYSGPGILASGFPQFSEIADGRQVAQQLPKLLPDPLDYRRKADTVSSTVLGLDRLTDQRSDYNDTGGSGGTGGAGASGKREVGGRKKKIVLPQLPGRVYARNKYSLADMVADENFLRSDPRGSESGIQNTTASLCYLNSVVQLLYSCVPFRNLILTAVAKHTNTQSLGGYRRLSGALANIFYNLNRNAIPSAEGLYFALGYAQDDIRSQADATDVLRKLLSELSDENDNLAGPIRELFGLDTIDILKAYHVPYNFAVNDSTMALLPAVTDNNVGDCVSRLFRPTVYLNSTKTSEGKPGGYPCDEYGIQDCKKTSYITKCPEVLFVTLNRFVLDDSGVKKNCDFVCPSPTLSLKDALLSGSNLTKVTSSGLHKNIRETIAETLNVGDAERLEEVLAAGTKDCEYELAGVVGHSGESTQGHWYVYSKNTEGEAVDGAPGSSSSSPSASESPSHLPWLYFSDREVNGASDERMHQDCDGMTQETKDDACRNFGLSPEDAKRSGIFNSGSTSVILMYVRKK